MRQTNLALLAAAALLAACSVLAAAQGPSASRPFWMDPPHCASGPLHGANHDFVFEDGFWGPRNDDSNRHGPLHCRGLDGGSARRFFSVDDEIGEMGYNTAGSIYMGEDYLVAGSITLEMRVQTDPGIPEHPQGVKQKDFLFRPFMPCEDCIKLGAWSGGANVGGTHFFKIANRLESKADQTLIDFDGIEYGACRVVIFNRVGEEELTPIVRRFPVEAMQPDQWVRLEITWTMGSTDATRGWNVLELEINGTNESFQLLDRSCPVGRMFQIGNVDRKHWNETGTGVMDARTCANMPDPGRVPPECRPSDRPAPFPNLQFRSLRLPVPGE
jgi:hypothetical protein